MSASVTSDKFTSTMSGGNPVATTVSSARSIGGTSLSVVSASNWPTGTAVYFVTYQKNTDGSINTSTLCSWAAVVSGTTLGSLTLKNGTDAGNAVGDYVEMGPTAAWAQSMYEGLTAIHNTDGTLKDGIIATAKIADDAITTAKVADGAITTDTLADNVVTAQKLATTAITLDYVSKITGFSTTSTSAVQVPGLTTTVTIPSGGRRVKITAYCSSVYTTGGTGDVVLSIWDGTVGSGTQLQGANITPGAASNPQTGIAIAVVTPSAGSKTYNVGLQTSSQTAQFQPLSFAPAFILVETI